MKKIGTCLLATLLLFACQSGQSPAQAKLQREIKALEKQIGRGDDIGKDKEITLQLIEKTNEYAAQYPQDTLTPTLLFRAGDAAKRVKEYGKAVELWGQVWRKYSKHPKAPMALFQQGFTFDSDLHDPAMAAKYYKKFLTAYPKDTLLTPQVKQLLSVIKVKPEDNIKKYETE